MALGLSCAAAGFGSAHADPQLDEARRTVERAAQAAQAWDGPTSGPPAQSGRTIAVVAEDLRNGGVLGVAQGIREAARAIGWRVRILDAGGSPDGRRHAVAEALASRPDGIAICGSDARELAPLLRAAGSRLPPVVGWHAGAQAGPVPGTPVAMNVTTDPIAVARTAALAAVAQSDGRAGVVVFTDSRFGIATAKSQAMAEVIRACRGCSLLEVRDLAISDSGTRMPAVTRELLARHGARWTHMLAINDIYFDHAVPVFIAAGIGSARLSMVSAGDGSAPAFMRIHAGSYQTGTVAEPLNLQGWQMIDELNRLMSGQPVSGYSAPVHLVTRDNANGKPGGRLVHDPDNGYREHYLRIWKGP